MTSHIRIGWVLSACLFTTAAYAATPLVRGNTASNGRTPVVNGSTAFGDLTPEQCAQGGSMGPAFTAPTLVCSVSPACENVKAVLAREAKAIEKEYARLCKEEAEDQRKVAAADCKDQCQSNQSEKDKRLEARIKRLRDRIDAANQAVDEARRAALAEAIDLGERYQMVKKGWRERIRVLYARVSDFFVPCARADYCADRWNKYYSDLSPGGECPGGTAPIIGKAGEKGPEAKALNGLGDGKTLSPSDLAGLKPIFREPLEAASFAQGSNNMLADRLNTIDRQLAALRNHKGATDNRVEHLASTGRSTFAEKTSDFSIEGGGNARLKKAAAAEGAKGSATTNKLDRPQLLADAGNYNGKSYDEMFGSKGVQPNAAVGGPDSRFELPDQGRLGSSGITSGDGASLSSASANGAGAEAGGNLVKDKADSAKRAALLREKLLRGKIGKGGAEEEAGRMPSSQLAEEAKRIYDNAENQLVGEKVGRNGEAFTMMGSETEAAIKGLLGDIQSSSDLPGPNSPGLFERVHQAHQSMARRWR